MANHTGQLSPVGAARAHQVVNDRTSYASISPRERRTSMLAAAGLHAALFAVLVYGLSPDLAVPRRPGYAITYADLGYAPPKGDPDGEDAPLQARNIEEGETPDNASNALEEDLEPEITPELALPSENLVPEVSQASAAEQPSHAENSEGVGSSTLAFGARVHGDQGGLDGDLAAAVGAMIATRIKACWDPPAEASPQALAITMTVSFDPSGALIDAPIIARLVEDEKAIVSEPNAYERAAIQAVERCTPLALPAHLFAYWRHIDIEIFSARPVETAIRHQSETSVLTVG